MCPYGPCMEDLILSDEYFFDIQLAASPQPHPWGEGNTCAKDG